jgi:hypothetical protein
MDEPSVLDYVKAMLTPWRGPAPKVPVTPPAAGQRGDEVFLSPPNEETLTGDSAIAAGSIPKVHAPALPWRTTSALFLALAAQSSLEPGPDRTWIIGTILYGLSFILIGWAYFSQEWTSPGAWVFEKPAGRGRSEYYSFLYSPTLFMLSMLLTLGGLWAFSGNRFNLFNLVLWLAALALVMRAFWLNKPGAPALHARLGDFLRRPSWRIEIPRNILPVLAALALVVFFRVYRLEEVPPQMVSDHAEKLLDVWDVLQGETSVFFTRNTGREGLQMYLTAVVVRLTGLELNFLVMKIGTVLAGLLTLPFIYLLGSEVGGSRRTGMLAVLFSGIAYWPNVITRVALRFTFYPLFVAPVLYYLVRGLRTSNRNDFILAGLFLGIGLHGYTPIRILPVLVVVGVVLFLLHKGSAGVRKLSIYHLVILALVSLVAFLPLLSFALQDLDSFGYRAFSRVGSIEQPLPGPALLVFMNNLWNAITMFAWNNGNIWLVSVGNRPALDIVSGALFHLGLALLLFRYIRKRDWLDLFLLVSIPILMLPSILSLAFPNENPALNRAGGALVPVFVVVGIALDGLLRVIERRFQAPLGRFIAWGLLGSLLLLSSTQNYALVFGRYQAFYEAASWNTSEMGQVIRGFNDTIGESESAWVLVYPHWVDTRLVGMNAGFPTRDYAIFPDQLASTLSIPSPKLFLVKPDDEVGQDRLEAFYPHGWFQVYHSQVENKDFLMFFVPRDGN